MTTRLASLSNGRCSREPSTKEAQNAQVPGRASRCLRARHRPTRAAPVTASRTSARPCSRSGDLVFCAFESTSRIAVKHAAEHAGSNDRPLTPICSETSAPIEITVPGGGCAHGGRVEPADSNAHGSRAYPTFHVRVGPLRTDR